MIITDNNFKDVIINNKVVVYLGASWCSGCKVVKPIVEKLETETLPALIGKCDVDSDAEISREYGIRNIPALLFFNNGEMVDKHIGTLTETQLRDKINTF